MTLAVNRAAVDAVVARRREMRQRVFGRWIARRLAVSLAAFYLVALLVKLFTTSPALREMSGWTLTAFLVVPAFGAFVVTVVAEQMTFGEDALDAERLSSRIGKEVGQLTGPRWPLRSLVTALELALCAGIPVAVVVYMTGRPVFLARASDAAIAVFAAGLILWALVTTFVLRAVTLHIYRDLLEQRPTA